MGNSVCDSADYGALISAGSEIALKAVKTAYHIAPLSVATLYPQIYYGAAEIRYTRTDPAAVFQSICVNLAAGGGNAERLFNDNL